MNRKQKVTGLMVATIAASAVIGFAAATGAGSKDVTQKKSETSVTTNSNGTVTRTFTECTVSTNGSLVTEHRRETRTTMDNDGNMLESSTSEYAQSCPVGGMSSVNGVETTVQIDTVEQPGKNPAPATKKATAPAVNSDSFLGLKFGTEFKGTNFVIDVDEPTLLRTTFTPKKKLAGFDGYYVYVTPKTHKVAKVYACSRQAVEPDTSWRRHYLIEALEKRYQTWARPRSAFRPIYSFDIGGGRFITTVLSGATADYETVIVAWDDAVLTTAADETEALRAEALKAAAEKRNLRVNDAASAF